MLNPDSFEAYRTSSRFKYLLLRRLLCWAEWINARDANDEDKISSTQRKMVDSHKDIIAVFMVSDAVEV